MNAPVDVLAVMDCHANGLRNASECGGLRFSATACKNISSELAQARAAVAELAEAAKEYRRLHDYPDSAGTKLDAALAKFGGGQ